MDCHLHMQFVKFVVCYVNCLKQYYKSNNFINSKKKKNPKQNKPQKKQKT